MTSIAAEDFKENHQIAKSTSKLPEFKSKLSIKNNSDHEKVGAFQGLKF